MPLHAMCVPSSLCSMCISQIQVLATYIFFLIVTVVLGSPLAPKNCVNVNKYILGKLGGFSGEQRATVWQRKLVNCALKHLCCKVVKEDK